VSKKKTVTNLIFEGAHLINNFVKELDAMASYHLIESTLKGKFHIENLHSICLKLSKVNVTMQKRIKNRESANKEDVEAIIEGIDGYHTPTVLSILKIFFKKRDVEVYDDEDKAEVHKVCQSYDQIVGQFRHNLLQLQLNNTNLKSLSPPQFHMQTKSAFKASNIEIDTYIGTIK
jgi:hypothetical protein